MKDVEGFILAGGLSSRMGVDKSRLRLGGRTFVEIAAGALAAVSDRVRVVGSRAGVESHGLPVVRDVHEGLGALGGLHAALGACGAPWAAVVPCDLPFVTGELRPRALLRAVRTRWVSFKELSDLDGSQRFFDNVNTPDDYERAVNRES